MAHPQAPQDDGFSDSDRVWLEHLDGLGDPADPSPAAREGDRLRWALEDEQATLRNDPRWAAATSDTAVEAHWLAVQRRLNAQGLQKPAPPAPEVAPPAPWTRLRDWLWPVGSTLPRAPAWAGAAAMVLLAVVLTRPPDTDIDIGPPLPQSTLVLRGNEDVLHVVGEKPRARAEAFAAALRAAGLQPGVFRRDKTVLVDVEVAPEALASATPAFQALGLQPRPGFVRVEFDRR